MGVCVNSGLGHAPDFTPHRVNVAAADGAAPTNQAAGMVSAPFEDVWGAVNINGTTSGVTIEVLYWSVRDGKFLQQSTPQTFALTASKMIKFSPGGQRFFLMITGSFTGVTGINIDCAGANPVIVESA